MRAASSAEELRAEADAALYEAKRARRPAVRRTSGRSASRVSVTTTSKREAVRRLVDEQRLRTVFQPIWTFDSGALLGVEALTRPDPSLWALRAAEAFDIAEQIGCVHELDELCAKRALRAGSSFPTEPCCS